MDRLSRMLAAAQGMGGGGGAPQQDTERAIDQYTWSLVRYFLSRNKSAGELQLPQACFAPTGQQACCYRNRGNASSASLSASAFTAHRKQHTLQITISNMPKRQKKPPPSLGEVISSSEASMSSSGETDSSPSPPHPPAPCGTPERVDHNARRNERNPSQTQSPRRQNVFRLASPRPRPSNSGRQMMRLDVDREVRQLERARRQQPESFGRRRAAAQPESAPSRPSAGRSRRTTLDRLLEQRANFENFNRRDRLLQVRVRRERQVRAAMLLADDNDTNIVDNAETVYISSLALLKMLRHGRAGVPMEVMGLMLGEFVDDYTVRVVDVFAMPQSGTGVSVEAVDPVFQTKMMDMLRQTGRPETVVGWYHSHPGFGCWLSSVDINTQQSFEQLTPRAVAVVIDPIQSVKGKVVIDAFRLINPQTLMLGQEPRQTTSNVGHLNKPSIQALIHGLNRHYYSIGIGYRKTALEENMLMNLHKTVWTEALEMPDFAHEGEHNHANLTKLVSLAEGYLKRVQEETELSKEQLRTRYVGKVDPKKHIEAVGQELMEDNIVAVSRQMIDKEASVPTLGQGNASNKGANGRVGEVMEVDGEDD
ncbi:hypothetical protein MBLNU13_g01236t2 [Cladosporium sp. NU13]